MAASKILNDRIPVVGVNTDPSRSEGYLCLPKHFNQNIDDAIDKIITGKFYWYLAYLQYIQNCIQLYSTY